MSIPIDEENVPINDGEYLEMVNHLKNTYDEISTKLFASEMQLMDLKKDLMLAPQSQI